MLLVQRFSSIVLQTRANVSVSRDFLGQDEWENGIITNNIYFQVLSRSTIHQVLKRRSNLWTVFRLEWKDWKSNLSDLRTPTDLINNHCPLSLRIMLQISQHIVSIWLFFYFCLSLSKHFLLFYRKSFKYILNKIHTIYSPPYQPSVITREPPKNATVLPAEKKYFNYR